MDKDISYRDMATWLAGRYIVVYNCLGAGYVKSGGDIGSQTSLMRSIRDKDFYTESIMPTGVATKRARLTYNKWYSVNTNLLSDNTLLREWLSLAISVITRYEYGIARPSSGMLFSNASLLYGLVIELKEIITMLYSSNYHDKQL